MASPDPQAGKSFGKYFLLKKLAAGGMGEIFLARQDGPAGFRKLVVVKTILAQLTQNAEFVESFLGEARLAAQMNHRNIVQVFELGQEGSVYFMAMEYVRGTTLRELIDAAAQNGERLHPDLCRQIAEMICEGASYAHNLADASGRPLNLVHRDLNPHNVLVSGAGDVKIIDFGIAKSEMSTIRTEAGMIKGKFAYMSPEQSMAKGFDKRSDIFSIGITLLEMLTGINPFQRNNVVLTLEAVQELRPRAPSELDPSYAPFDAIVAKALAKDRDRRYSDGSEMQDDLRSMVLPRSAERLGALVTRLFQQKLGEEQKLLVGGQTPEESSPSPASQSTVISPLPPVAPALGADDEDATMVFAGAARLESPPVAQPDASTDPRAEQSGSADARDTDPGESTAILAPHEALTPQSQGIADQADRSVFVGHTRVDRRREARKARSLWLAVATGALGAIAAIVGLLLLMMADDSTATPRPQRPAHPSSAAQLATPPDPVAEPDTARIATAPKRDGP